MPYSNCVLATKEKYKLAVTVTNEVMPKIAFNFLIDAFCIKIDYRVKNKRKIIVEKKEQKKRTCYFNKPNVLRDAL